MPNYEERFIRCLKCGNPYFLREEKVVLAKEPVRFREEDYERVPPVVTQIKTVYVCSECKEVLNRAKAALAAEEARKPQMVKQINTPIVDNPEKV